MTTSVPDASFQTAFGPLAHHFFPDGCPIVVASSTDSSGGGGGDLGKTPPTTAAEAVYLQKVWPVSTSRSAVSSAAAIQSIADVTSYAAASGLTAPEMVAVALVGTATLPAGPSKARSPMRDGSAAHFCALVRHMLPRIGRDRLAEAENAAWDQALVVASSRLLSACCRYGGVPRELAKARRCLLQFLSLTLGSWKSLPLPQSCATTVFQWARHPATCVDAIRVLWDIPGTLPSYRVHQLKAFYNSEQELKLSPLAQAAVADLLERYNEQRMIFSSRRPTDWLNFPDMAWQEEFIREYCVGECADSGARRRSDCVDRRPSKRSRHSRRDVQRIVTHIRNAAAQSAHNAEQKAGALSSAAATAVASDMLEDGFMQHLSSLSPSTLRGHSRSVTKGDDIYEGDGVILHRFRSILAHKLPEQWHDSSDPPNPAHDTIGAMRISQPKSSTETGMPRLRVLVGMGDFALSTGCLPIEAEAFFLQNILPSWDGDSDSELGRALLNALCYIQPSTADESQRSLDVRAARGGQVMGICHLFNQLERLFLYGDDRLRHAIISGTLATLVYRWGLTSLLTSPVAEACPSTQELEVGGSALQCNRRLQQELCQWTGELLLKGFLASDEGCELLRAATVDFFLAICDLADDCATTTAIFLAVTASPSPSIMYRLLLSSSPVHVDRVCHLMVRYRSIFQRLKEHLDTGGDSSAESETSVGMTQIKVFNCFVWDFCSVLWRCSRPPPPQHIANGTGERARAFSILYTDLRIGTQQRLFVAATTPTNTEAPGFSLSSALSITHGSVFSAYVSDFSRERGYDSPDLLRGNIKVQYLDYLKSRGLNGLHEFLSTFVGSLAGRRMA